MYFYGMFLDKNCLVSCFPIFKVEKPATILEYIMKNSKLKMHFINQILFFKYCNFLGV